MRTFLTALMASSALLVAGPAAARSGDVSLCTSQVDLDWQDLHLDPDDADESRTNWFVGTVATSSAGSGCAGVPQTLSLLDADGTVLYQGRVVLDAEGNGRYEDLSVRAEDLWSAQVLLHAPAGTGGGDGAVTPAGVGIPVEPGGGAGPLARTGFDLPTLLALALALLVAGVALRRRRSTA